MIGDYAKNHTMLECLWFYGSAIVTGILVSCAMFWMINRFNS